MPIRENLRLVSEVEQMKQTLAASKARRTEALESFKRAADRAVAPAGETDSRATLRRAGALASGIVAAAGAGPMQVHPRPENTESQVLQAVIAEAAASVDARAEKAQTLQRFKQTCERAITEIRGDSDRYNMDEVRGRLASDEEEPLP